MQVHRALVRRCVNTSRSAIRRSARLLGRGLPLDVRQRLLLWADRRRFPGGFELSMGLLDDLRRTDPDALHRFLWSNHLAYAARYDVSRKFGRHNINPTRHLLFRQMHDYFRSRGVDPDHQIRSIFEVGCSMGYLLRHVEEEVFPRAGVLHGLDIDRHAVESGTTHLNGLGSLVRLHHADLDGTARTMAGRIYDVVFCCGVLMYVNQQTAQEVLRTMFRHARWLVGLVCLAHPDGDRAPARVSSPRDSDGAYIHDVKHMVREAGGKVVFSEWVGTRTSGSSPSHVILAEPSEDKP